MSLRILNLYGADLYIEKDIFPDNEFNVEDLIDLEPYVTFGIKIKLFYKLFNFLLK